MTESLDTADAEIAGRERTAKPDPKTSKRRLLECGRCHEPVASSGWSGVVIVVCGYCSFTEERQLPVDGPEGTIAVGDGPYRTGSGAGLGATSTSTSTSGATLELALGDALPAHPVTSLDATRLRNALARTPRDGEDPRAVEWERVWIAVWLAMQRAIAGDPLRARIALETTLLATHTPAYRGLLLAHLAQHAAAIGAPVLAKKWLKACPEVAVAEIESEVRAARAMIDLARDKPALAVERTGGRKAGEGFAGHAVLLAIAVNVEAHERRGDVHLADAILADLRKKKLLAPVMAFVSAFGVARRSVARYTQRLRRGLTLRTALLSAAALLALLVFRPLGFAHAILAAVGAGAVCGAITWTYWGASFRTPFRRRAWWAATTLTEIVVMVLATVWLVRAAPPPSVARESAVAATATATAQRSATPDVAPTMNAPQLGALDLGGGMVSDEAMLLLRARSELDEGETDEAVAHLEECVRSYHSTACSDALAEAKKTQAE